MSDLPRDWFSDHDGQSLVLDPEKVRDEIDRLREEIQALLRLTEEQARKLYIAEQNGKALFGSPK